MMLRSRWSTARQRYWPIAMLIVAPTILFAPIVLGGRVLYWGVPLLQFYPWQRLAAESYRAGQAPLWNSLIGSGAPLAANLQAGAFYPLNFLYFLLPIEYAMSYTAALHVILAGLFMYAYLRTIKLSPLAALIGALAFQMCGFLIARFAFLSITATFPWLAAWLWRAEKLLEGGTGRGWEAEIGNQRYLHRAADAAQVLEITHRPANSGRDKRLEIRNWLGLALVIGLGTLAGHAQTAVYGLVLVSAYAVWRVVTLSPRHRVTLSLSFAFAVIVGLSLAAIQLLPAAELTRESQRAGGLEYIKVMTHSYWPPRLLALFSPDYFGNPAQNNYEGYNNYWENAAYIGLLPLLLALWVIWRWLRRRESFSPFERSPLIPFFALAAILSLILALGWFAPIYPFLYEHVPGFGLFQGPARWLVVTEVSLCVLAGLGLQVWLERGLSRRAGRRLLMMGLALSPLGFALSFILKGNIATLGPATLRLGALLIVAALLFQSKIENTLPKILLVVVVVADLITAHFALNPTLPPDIYHAPNPAAEAIKADGSIGRVFYFDTDEAAIKFGAYLAHDNKFDGYGPNDLDYWLGVRAALLPNAGMIDGVPAANNFDSLIVERYQTLLDTINRLPLNEALPILSRMHVGYIVSPRELDLPVVYRTPDVTIYRNDRVLPRAWIAPAEADLARVETALPGSNVESLTDSGNAVTIRAASPAAGWLILADVWYPGWQAYVDGLSTEIQVANGAFRAVRFPAGAHTIEFRYEPRSFSLGVLVSLTSAVIIAGGLGIAIGRKRRTR